MARQAANPLWASMSQLDTTSLLAPSDRGSRSRIPLSPPQPKKRGLRAVVTPVNGTTPSSTGGSEDNMDELLAKAALTN